MRLITTAKTIALRLHKDQKDKAGAPYFYHLERTVAHLLKRWPDAAEMEIAAAWLHDSLEDTGITASELMYAGIPRSALGIIQAVTRRNRGQPYLDWIRGMAAGASSGAIRVKIADIMDNSDPARLAALGEAGKNFLKSRYEPARAILEAALSAQR